MTSAQRAERATGSPVWSARAHTSDEQRRCDQLAKASKRLCGGTVHVHTVDNYFSFFASYSSRARAQVVARLVVSKEAPAVIISTASVRARIQTPARNNNNDTIVIVVVLGRTD